MYTVLKTFRAAWYLPEASGESEEAVRLSRVLLVVLPAVSIFSTIVAGAPIGGIYLSIFLSLVASFAFILTIYMLFRRFIPLVESYLRKERNKDVKLGALVQEFMVYPKYTSLPIYETVDGVWVGYGHIPKTEFIDAVACITEKLTGNVKLSNEIYGCESHVEHVYAVLIKHPAIHGELYFRYAEMSAVGAFPITRLYI